MMAVAEAMVLAVACFQRTMHAATSILRSCLRLCKVWQRLCKAC